MLSARADSLGTWRDARGEVEVLRLRASIAYIRMVGVAGEPAGQLIERLFAKEFAGQPRLHTFWDLRDLQNYHSEVRIRSTNALLAVRPRLQSVHAFSRSRLVAMGVSVANLAIGGIAKTHTSAESFDAALDEIMRLESRPSY